MSRGADIVILSWFAAVAAGVRVQPVIHIIHTLGSRRSQHRSHIHSLTHSQRAACSHFTLLVLFSTSVCLFHMSITSGTTLIFSPHCYHLSSS